MNQLEPVSLLGLNPSNSNNKGHTGKGNNPTVGYNKYQEKNIETGRYTVNVESEGNNLGREEFKYLKEQIHLIKDVKKSK